MASFDVDSAVASAQAHFVPDSQGDGPTQIHMRAIIAEVVRFVASSDQMEDYREEIYTDGQYSTSSCC